MAIRCLLVYIPDYPFQVHYFMPKRMLARAAGALRAQGHETLVADLGVVETLARVVPKPADTLAPPRRPVFDDVEGRYRAWIVASLGALTDGFRPDLIVLYGSRPEHARSVLMGAEELRALCPGAAIVAWGPMWSSANPLPPPESTPLDGVLPYHQVNSLVMLAERASEGESWEWVPSLAFRREGAWRHVPALKTQLFDDASAPAYDPAIYPALSGDGMFKVFEIEECRSIMAAERDDATPWAGFPRPVEDIRREIADLSEHFGARAFHLLGCDGSTQRVEHLAFDIMATQPRALYTRDIHVEAVDGPTCSAMLVSGCCGLRIPVPTGSQRLLDDFYGAGCTVTEIEHALGLANQYGLYRLMELLYPSTEDDYHTRAETLRLIRRTHPDGVRICLPEEELCLDAGNGERGARRAQLGLAHAIRKCGVAPNVDVREALLAALAGTENRDGYIRRIKRLVRAGDADEVAAAMRQVNALACLPQNAVALRPFVPVRNAVGN